jgi:hypothetical protein
MLYLLCKKKEVKNTIQENAYKELDHMVFMVNGNPRKTVRCVF